MTNKENSESLPLEHRLICEEHEIPMLVVATTPTGHGNIMDSQTNFHMFLLADIVYLDGKLVKHRKIPPSEFPQYSIEQLEAKRNDKYRDLALEMLSKKDAE